jgi:hypothetical protein
MPSYACDQVINLEAGKTSTTHYRKLFKTGEFKSFAPIGLQSLGVAPRAFENWQKAILLVLEYGKQVAHEQLSFEKRAAQRPPLLKAGQSRRF